nr:hypothetical protein [uncultured Methanoregula sp.]
MSDNTETKVLIEVYNTSMVLCGVVDGYEKFQYVEKIYDFDTFEITANRYHANVSKFILGGYIRFYDGREHIAIIESIEKPKGPDGKASETWKISGRGIEAIFAQYPCLYNTATGTGYHDTPATVVPTITFTFAASATVTASANCTGTVEVGHYIYNSTNDTAAKAVKISAISANGLTITLVSAYAGTAGSGKAAMVCGCHGETALRQYVDKECISTSDTAAVLPGLALAADSKRGDIVMRSQRFDPLSDLLFGVSKEALVFFRLVHGTGLNFVFTVYTSTDVSDTVTITTKYENVAQMKFIESLLEMKNVLYVGGAGDGAARLVRKTFSGDTEPTGWNRRAKFIDAQDLTTNAELDAKGAEVLATTKESLSLEVEYLPSPTFTLGVQFDIGDIIKTIFEDEEGEEAIETVARITTITKEWTADAKKSVKLGLGKEAPDLVSIMKLYRKLNTAQSRR